MFEPGIYKPENIINWSTNAGYRNTLVHLLKRFPKITDEDAFEFIVMTIYMEQMLFTKYYPELKSDREVMRSSELYQKLIDRSLTPDEASELDIFWKARNWM